MNDTANTDDQTAWHLLSVDEAVQRLASDERNGLTPELALPLRGAVLLTFVLQLATIYVPALNPIFHTQPLPPAELGICLLLSASVFVAVEIEKWMVRRGWLYR